jgi:hypothetical protein
MKAPIEIIVDVADIGGRLEIIDGKLRTLLPADCPTELEEAIRLNTVQLINLLRLDFLVIRRKLLDQTEAIYWTPDEATKMALAGAGAYLDGIFSAPEIELLERVAHERITIEDMWLGYEATL